MIMKLWDITHFFQIIHCLRKDQVSVYTGNSSEKWAQVTKVFIVSRRLPVVLAGITSSRFLKNIWFRSTVKNYDKTQINQLL